MTRSKRLSGGKGSASANELYIEFDRCQLTVRTDVKRIYDFVTRTYEHMLVSAVVSSAGEIAVFRTTNGYSVVSHDSLNLMGSDPEPLLPFFEEEVILQFIRARPELLWLHAGSVERDDEALVMSGPSGRGKSTLVTMLCARGWHLMSDDVAPLRMDTDAVLPFFPSPLRRIHPGRSVGAGEIGTLKRETVPIAPAMLRRDPARVRAIVFPEYLHGAPAKLSQLTQGSAALEILRNARNFVDHKGAAVERAAKIARDLPVYRLEYGVAAEAALLLDSRI